MQNVVSRGLLHKVIKKDQPHIIDIVEGTHQYSKIEIDEILSPMELTFQYKDNMCDLKVIYSTKNRKPEEKACQSVESNP